MKVKIIGSIYHLPENEQDGIKNAGIELGKRLAKENIPVILGALRTQVIYRSKYRLKTDKKGSILSHDALSRFYKALDV